MIWIIIFIFFFLHKSAAKAPHIFIKKIKEYIEKKGTRQKPLKKVISLKLGNPNLFLMYSDLIESGTSFQTLVVKRVKERPMLTKLSTQKLPSLKI